MTIKCTVASLTATASHDIIEEAITSSFTVNCTFSPGADIANLIALTISKYSDDYTVDELASINSFNSDHVNELNPIEASASGFIGANGPSYISLAWPFPTSDESGLYSCKALGMDALGHTVEVDYNVTVTTKTSTLSQLIQAVRLERMQMYQISKDISSLATEIKELSSVSTLQNNTFFSELDGLRKRVSDLERYLGISSISYPSTTVTSRYNDQGTQYVILRDSPSTDRDAQVACLLQGGYLAEIDDQDEFDFIHTFLKETAPDFVQYVIVGAKFITGNGLWTFPYSQREVNLTSWMLSDNWSARSRPLCLFLSKSDDWGATSSQCIITTDYTRILCEIPFQQ